MSFPSLCVFWKKLSLILCLNMDLSDMVWLSKNFLTTGFVEYGEIINLSFLCVFLLVRNNEHHRRSFTIVKYNQTK